MSDPLTYWTKRPTPINDRHALTGGHWQTGKGGIRRFIEAPKPVKPDPTRCGTDGGYRKHLRLNEETCADCRAAHRRRQNRIRLQGRRATKPPLKPCGTHAAFNRHALKGETPCAECVTGEREYQASRHRNRTGRKAA